MSVCGLYVEDVRLSGSGAPGVVLFVPRVVLILASWRRTMLQHNPLP